MNISFTTLIWMAISRQSTNKPIGKKLLVMKWSDKSNEIWKDKVKFASDQTKKFGDLLPFRGCDYALLFSCGSTNRNDKQLKFASDEIAKTAFANACDKGLTSLGLVVKGATVAYPIMLDNGTDIRTFYAIPLFLV